MPRRDFRSGASGPFYSSIAPGRSGVTFLRGYFSSEPVRRVLLSLITALRKGYFTMARKSNGFGRLLAAAAVVGAAAAGTYYYLKNRDSRVNNDSDDSGDEFDDLSLIHISSLRLPFLFSASRFFFPPAVSSLKSKSLPHFSGTPEASARNAP